MHVANASDGKRIRVGSLIGNAALAARLTDHFMRRLPHLQALKKANQQFMNERRLLVTCFMVRWQAEQDGVHVLPGAENGARLRQHLGPRTRLLDCGGTASSTEPLVYLGSLLYCNHT